LVAAFGVNDPILAAQFLSQVVNVLHADPRLPVETTTIDTSIAFIKGFKPTDTLEAATVTMLISAQHAALDMMRRALHPEQTPAGRALYLGLSLKAMRTFAQLLEILNHGRGKGVVQRVIIERIERAVVGPVQLQPGGGKSNRSINPKNRAGPRRYRRSGRG
jgi:hypothetical protein